MGLIPPQSGLASWHRASQAAGRQTAAIDDQAD